MDSEIKVGIGICLIKNGKILFSKRKGSHAAGQWGFVGGHLKKGESFSQCAQREIREETNLKIKNIKFLTITNDIFKRDNKHYITIFLKAQYSSGKLKIMEPNKFNALEWFNFNNPPKPLMRSVKNFYKLGINPCI